MSTPKQEIVAVKAITALSDAELASLIRVKLGPVDTAHAVAEEVKRRLVALRLRCIVTEAALALGGE